jgi:hypothetical protein
MSGGDSSRPENDAFDYFNNQNKKLALADRRPVIRRASDLVGPGIADSAVRITDFNNMLATFNGYYSAAAGATNAPNDTGEFVGTVVMDAEFGGRQVFTDMDEGSEYTRVFQRAPADPETITWGAWRRRWRATPTALGYLGSVNTPVASGGIGGTPLFAPDITTGQAADDLYSTDYAGGGRTFDIAEQGVYTGNVTVLGPPSVTVYLSVNLPSLAGSSPIDQSGVLDNYLRIPFVCVNRSLVPVSITIDAFQASGSTQNIRWTDIQITRVGDAI